MASHNQKYLDFLFDLYSEGITLPQAQIDLLVQHNYIKEDNRKKLPTEPAIEDEFPLGQKKTEEENEFDNELITVLEQETPGDEISFFDPRKHVHKKFLETKHITRDMWMPESIIFHKKDFADWIDSFIFYGFRNMIVYSKFELYKKQAYDWLLENDVITNYVYPEDIEEFKQRELDRCAANALYCLNKYGKIKDAAIEGGWRVFTATPAHEVICYLDDCGYSMFITKPRQMAATSCLGLLANRKIIFKKNHFIKFITQDKEKGLEIYEDKIKASFTAFPEWMTPDVLNWSGSHLRLGNKGERKGRNEGVGSSILVDAPSITAIAGGSPSTTLVDESGNIGIFSQMYQDARPTMFSQDPITHKIKMTRQLIAWGTGGDLSSKNAEGKSFEFEYMEAVKAWKKRDWGSGIIPVFFDWTCRPGVTQEFYDQQKKEAFEATGPDAAKKKVKFYQQLPCTIEEVFLSSQATLVDIEFIRRNEKRIDDEDYKSRYGYFEPIFDESQPMPEDFDIPYKVIDARFIETDAADPRATTIIFQFPKKGWENRYYQGTDPIAAEAGNSNMASAIWDAEYNTLSAVVDHREQNYKYDYLQCMLLGIYYDVERKVGVKDLLESNIGAAYRDYKEARGRWGTLTFTSELPQQFRTQSGSQLIGIDNKMTRKKLIVDKLFELLTAYGERIFIRRVFEQLKTFVCKETEQGNTTWGPVDRKYYKDDVLWAMVYAYINRQAFSHLIPTKTLQESHTSTVEYQLYRDSNWKLRRRPIKVRTQ